MTFQTRLAASNGPVSVAASEVAVAAASTATSAKDAAAISAANALAYKNAAAASAASISGGPVTSVSGKTGVVVLEKGDVGLANVDNTSDSSKPVSTAQATAIAAKQDVLVSGTNIKTVNGQSLLGSGDLATGGSSITDYTASTTWTKPAWAKAVLVEAWAGGGGGGNHTLSTGYAQGAHGGQYVSRLFRADELPETVSLVVGLGGLGAATGGNNNGTAGGDTTFGSLLTARGGRHGGSSASSVTLFYPGFIGSSFTATLTQEFYAMWFEIHRIGYGLGAAMVSASYSKGGNALNGGAGGGAAITNTSAGLGGVSLNGGSGGTATINGTPAGAGGFPSGGGGGANNNGGGGKGGDGLIRITVLG